MGKGSTRNEQKANEDRDAEARRREDLARAALKAYKMVPVNSRPEDFAEKVKRQRGILKKAISGRKKSETHSRKAKGGGR